MWLEPVTILATAVPTTLKSDGRKSICVVGEHPELGLIRLYPANIRMVARGLRRWNVVRVNIEQTRNDNREESWKFINDGWDDAVQKCIEPINTVHGKKKRLSLLQKYLCDCQKDKNDAHLSICIVKPLISSWGIRSQGVTRKNGSHACEKFLHTKGDYAIEPFVQYRCGPKCRVKTRHHQQILEWGAYEWFRKCQVGEARKVFDNYCFGNLNYDHYFIVGNQANERTSWMVIAPVWFKKNLRKVITEEPPHSLGGELPSGAF